MKCKYRADHQFSHEENRYKICYLCFGKTQSMFKIEGVLLAKLKDVLNTNFISEERVPAYVVM